MGIETLCPSTIETTFGRPLESVKAPSRDELIARPEIGTISIKNPRVVELKITPQSSKPEVNVKMPEPLAPITESTKKEEYIEGPIFAFGVGSYKKLYGRYLEVSGGDIEFAKRYTRMAIINDGTSFVQEYFPDVKDKNGQYVIKDHVMRAQLAHTPTKNEYVETVDPKTGKKIITSPEYIPLGSSITEFVSGFRRGADLAMISLIEEVTTSLPTDIEGEIANELIWVSPKSEDHESFWVQECCRKFDYKYKGSWTKEAGIRKLIVHSYRGDSSTDSHLKFMQDLEGKSYQASYDGLKDEDRDEKGQLRKVDIALRTLTVLDRPVTDEEIISRSHQAKSEIESSDLMFKLDEGAMQYANNPFLRDQVEKEVVTPIADWLVEQIAADISENHIQNQVEGRYIKALENFVKKTEKADQNNRVISYTPGSTPINYTERKPISAQETLLIESLRKRAEVGGGFCGKIGESSSEFGSSSIIGSSNVLDFVSRTGGFTRGGGISLNKEGAKCSTCSLELCEGRCPNCEKNNKKEEDKDQNEEYQKAA